VIAFPVEGWRSSAAVVVRQRGDSITGDVHGADDADAERAWRQALATVSLDVDGLGFIDIGRRNLIIGRLQAEYANLRPVLFTRPMRPPAPLSSDTASRSFRRAASGSGWRSKLARRSR